MIQYVPRLESGKVLLHKQRWRWVEILWIAFHLLTPIHTDEQLMQASSCPATDISNLSVCDKYPQLLLPFQMLHIQTSFSITNTQGTEN